ncbi:rhodanese-like domain-containing protein [Actinocorallia aurea]
MTTSAVIRPAVTRPAVTRPAVTRPAVTRPAGARSIDEILAEARARLVRLSPEEAHAEHTAGEALLIDIRPAAQRAAEGEIPGALVIERNVLEWRLDPESDARIAEATGYDVRAVVFCSEGYTSSLAAAALQDLGLSRATDLEGGITAWRSEGLPVAGTVSAQAPPARPEVLH